MGSNTITPPQVLNRNSSDDEILGLLTQPARRIGRRETKGDARDSIAQDSTARANEQLAMDSGEKVAQRKRRDSPTDTETAAANAADLVQPEHLRAVLDANPELRDSWQEANAYRETLATPEVARAATAMLGDLNRMDALFFSRRPEDLAELARAVAKLGPDAFASFGARDERAGE